MAEEEYPYLHRAPIVEAVIHWETEPGKTLDQDVVKDELRRLLRDYPTCNLQQGFEILASGGPGGESEVRHRTKSDGFRLKREDKPFVVQFTPHGVICSRLAPYGGWEDLEREGMRLWKLFVELAEPVLIKRLGTRFINRIPLRTGEQVSDVLLGSPREIDPDFTSEAFFYKDTFRISESPYHVNWIRTVQQSVGTCENGLIVDIDVGCRDVTAVDTTEIKKHLAEMRRIKNHVFFGCIDPKRIERFK